MNNKLRDIRIRRSSIFDQQQEERDKQRIEYLEEIAQLTGAWMNPKLAPDLQKRSFLNDYVNKARAIGLKKTTEVLIPCLINAFNSDEVVHPDIYDAHAALLFGNMGGLIEYLGKEGRKTITHGSDSTS
jgi:hypothetical protein